MCPKKKKLVNAQESRHLEGRTSPTVSSKKQQDSPLWGEKRRKSQPNAAKNHEEKKPVDPSVEGDQEQRTFQYSP